MNLQGVCSIHAAALRPKSAGDGAEEGDSMIARGNGADVELLGSHLKIIRHKGFGNFVVHGLKGDKEIAISAITSVQFRRAGTITSGYMQFGFMGGTEAKGGLLEAAQDENTVMFDKTQEDDFIAIKDELERLRGAPQQRASAADEIAKFADLRDKGIITAEEFEAKKRQLLGL